jgi:NOL1/NOP2/fmu family ribosome biogenesis protein
VNILAENISRWGSANVLVTQNDPRDFKELNGFFNLVIVDAPCSGSGLFRKDNDAIGEWSPEHVKLCSQRQQRILHDILPALADNGVLIYSTCSYSKEEDEDILDWLVESEEMESISLPFDEQWGIVESVSDKAGAKGYRFYPDKTKGEGFFLACLRKIKNETGGPKTVKRRDKPAKKQTDLLDNWIQNPDNLCYFTKGEWLIALPVALEEDYLISSQSLRIKKGGILMGKLSHQGLVPDHELAMSGILNHSLPFKNLSQEMAILYLRKENFEPEIQTRGWALVGYEGLKLGWIKVLDKRINNYYPSSWRILKA